MNKNEIIKLAKQFGTYDASQGPEICNLLGPETPATKSDPDKISGQLKNLQLDKLLEESINNAEIID